MIIAPNMTQREYRWTDWKSAATLKTLIHQYEDDGVKYTIWGYDGPEVLITTIWKGDLHQSTIDAGYSQAQNDADKTDFETNWKPTGNKSIIAKDDSGSAISRVKTTRTGWHYEPRSIDFYTSTAGSVYNRKHDGHTLESATDFGDAVLKFYDSTGAELVKGGGETDLEYQARLDASCVKTVMDWQPTYDMDIIGAVVMILNPPVAPQKGYAWAIVAPDVPASYGGSVPFLGGGWNLRFFANPSYIPIDGRGVKSMAYDPVYKSNKIRTIWKHDAGLKIGIQILFEHFKA